MSANVGDPIDNDPAAIATQISRERNLPLGRRAKSGSAAFRVRIRRVAASTRSPPDIIFEYSARFQRQFETRDKCSDRAREFERRGKVLPRIFETLAENNSRERIRRGASNRLAP